MNALNPTESMVRQGILNLKKGYEFNPIWSGLTRIYKECRREKD